MPRLPTRTEITDPADDDLIHVVDVSDTTSDPTGTSKKVQFSNFLNPTVLRSEWLQNGFVDKSESTLTFNDGTRVFTINPTGASFRYYVQGILYTVSTSDVAGTNTVTLTDTEGLWVIYYDDETLTALNSPSHAQYEDVIMTKAIVTLIYYDATNNKGILYEERHGYSMAPFTHRYLHETVGMAYADGLGLGNFTIGDGSLNAHAQFSIASGECYDEDNAIDLNTIGTTTGTIIFYRSGSDWRWTTQTGFKCLTFDGTSATRLAYDNSGVLTEVSNTKFTLIHIFATNAYDGNPITIIGQNEYNTIIAARDGAETEISDLVLGSLPSEEMKPIATVIYQTADAYANDVNAKIVQTGAGDNYIDWRTSSLSAGVGAQDHGSLGGLADDDHEQYLLADGTRDLTGDWTIATNNITLTAGTLTAAAGQFDNINIDGSTISDTLAGDDLILTTTTNGNIVINPDGTGIITNLTNPSTSFDNFFVLDKAAGSPATDQSQLLQNGFESGTNFWQSFTTGTTGFLTSIDIRTIGGASSVVLYIYEGEGTGGTLISTTTIGTIGSGIQTLTITNPPYLKTGTQYTYRVTCSTASKQFQTGNPYAGGRSSVNATYDFYFLTRMDSGFPFVYDNTNNRVGIGTATPSYELEVIGDITASATIQAEQLTSTDDILANGLIEIDGGTTAYPTLSNTSAIYASEDPGSGTYPFNAYGHLVLQARRSGSTATDRDIVFVTGYTPAVRMFIKDTGQVNIGSGSNMTTGLLNFGNLGSSSTEIISFAENATDKIFSIGYNGVGAGADNYYFIEGSTSSNETFRIYDDGRVYMVDVYSDTVSSTPKILSIQSDGQLGESTNATPTFSTVVATTFTGDLTGNADTATALETARNIGGVSFDGTADIVPTTIVVADTTDTTCYVGLWESATGNLLPKSDAGLIYNATDGELQATIFTDGQAYIYSGIGEGFLNFTVDNINLNGNKISTTSGALTISGASGDTIFTNDIYIDESDSAYLYLDRGAAGNGGSVRFRTAGGTDHFSIGLAGGSNFLYFDGTVRMGYFDNTNGEFFLPQVYSDTVATSPKVLSIQSDGQLGESTTATPTFSGVHTDTITEKTAANGVSIEGVNLKDNNLTTSSTSPRSFVIDSTDDKTELDLKRGATNRDVIIRYYTTSTNTWKVGMTDDATNHFRIQDGGTATDVIKAEYGTNGNVEINPNGTGGVISNSHFVGLGTIDGLMVEYSTTTAVKVTRGFCEANGSFYELTSDTSHSMTSLASGFDFHYIYIDDSASTPPTLTIIDSTSEPTWSDSKMGWYGTGTEPASPSTNDRCIGVVPSSTGASTVLKIAVKSNGKNVVTECGIGDSDYSLPGLSNNQNPDGTWQTPNTNNGSAVTPVMAVALKINISNTDSGSRVQNGVNHSEITPSGNFRGQLSFIAYDEDQSVGWVVLGASRNLLIAGIDTNDNNQDSFCVGYEYTR